MLESCYKYSLKLDVHRCCSKHLLLKSLQILLENTCLRVLFNKVAGLQNIFFFCEFCELFKNTYFVGDLWATGSETAVGLFKNIFFAEHLQWLLLTVSGFQRAADVFLCILQNFFRTSFDWTPPDDCLLCLSVNFENLFNSGQKKKIKNKKYYSLRKCRWREISSPVRLQFFFFNQFSGDLLFF